MAVHADETDWAAQSPEQLAGYATAYEDMSHDADPDDIDWCFVEDIPVGIFGSQDYWRQWWDEQNAEADRNGGAGCWDHLLDEEVRRPVVAAFYGREGGFDRFSLWDGNHRVAACALTGRPTVKAVVGVLRGVDAKDLPEALRRVLPERAVGTGPRR